MSRGNILLRLSQHALFSQPPRRSDVESRLVAVTSRLYDVMAGIIEAKVFGDWHMVAFFGGGIVGNESLVVDVVKLGSRFRQRVSRN